LENGVVCTGAISKNTTPSSSTPWSCPAIYGHPDHPTESRRGHHGSSESYRSHRLGSARTQHRRQSGRNHPGGDYLQWITSYAPGDSNDDTVLDQCYQVYQESRESDPPNIRDDFLELDSLLGHFPHRKIAMPSSTSVVASVPPMSIKHS